MAVAVGGGEELRRKKIVKFGENYLEVDVPDYANGETIPECVVIEPAYEKLKEPKMTFIDKIVNFFDECIYKKVKNSDWR